MASKVSNFSDLIQRVTASCLLHPLAGVSRPDDLSTAAEDDDFDNAAEELEEEEEEEEEGEEEKDINIDWRGGVGNDAVDHQPPPPRIMELEMLMSQVFDAVSTMKRAYVSVQEAYSPWDPDKMRVADVAVVAELRRLGLLRERFRRSIGGGGGRAGRWGMGAATVREVVAPYEAAVEELKREVKAKQVEIEGLTEKLKTATSFDRMGGKSKGKTSKKRVSCTTQG